VLAAGRVGWVVGLAAGLAVVQAANNNTHISQGMIRLDIDNIIGTS